MADSITRQIFHHLFSSVAEEMGVRLQRAAFSSNIKERCDFSCALFDSRGRLVAHAAHIPVHLGAMPLSVKTCVDTMSFSPGDSVILNDPFQGGTHLPDVTMVSPIFTRPDDEGSLVGYVANRAHHADIGGISPGSMPIAQEIYQEGVIIPPIKLQVGGSYNHDLLRLLLANVRTPEEREGDFQAQMAANRTGLCRMQELVTRYGQSVIEYQMGELIQYSETMMKIRIGQLPDGVYRFEDWLDGDGVKDEPIGIQVAITIQGEHVEVDFTGTSPQQKGSVNAVYAVTVSAVAYVFQCLLGEDIPSNEGTLAPITVVAPLGSVVNAQSPAAVAAGNVETSQRLVDVLLGALSQACPDQVPAASQGTMNNLALGGWDGQRGRHYAYYETIGGGVGAGKGYVGSPAMHSHMTNTMNTPIEALEYDYPLRVTHYGIRRGSGGKGQFDGGDGICREIEFLQGGQATILSERRRFAPYGLRGGDSAQKGQNFLIRNQQETEIPEKVTLDLLPGDRLRMETPGGGGYGPLNANLDSQ
ncbi:MAG: hydantoinase B/oxoprolinase family protein [Nitrospirae bacterium]|nr:hydantoinase B/oxoprolinase family protein [Nitrospirota bacterium]